MSPTSQSAASSEPHSPQENFRVIKKRNRVPLSCYPCRSRKKCDRGHPCANCVKRGMADSAACSYANPSSKKKSQSQASQAPDDMQNRIDRLEGLVLSLMHGGANISPEDAAAAGAAAAAPRRRTMDTTASTPGSNDLGSSGIGDDGEMEDEPDEEDEVDAGLATSLGVLKVDPRGKSMYIGDEHWHTILADIAEVKGYFANHKKELETKYERVLASKPVTALSGPTLLLGAVPATDDDLRAELPSKSSILTLCSRYFNSLDGAVYIIHSPSFHKQLRAHWNDPSKTPIMWLGLLYAIMTIAMLSYDRAGDEPPAWKGRTLEMAAEYRMRTVQCLINADYTKPSEYTVETMLLYVFGEFSSRWDADMGLWMILGIVTRIALRMGYHRDAKWFPSLSPFQAEMRRRVWALVRICDVVFSHQVSLPGMIHDDECDTGLPHNLFDEEFNPETKVLPKSRPVTEPTPISYMIAKSRLCNELGNILHATTKTNKTVSYDEILHLDRKLRQIRRELPPHLQMQPLENNTDALPLVVARFNCDILYLKIMCLLHRKYVTKATASSRYAHSRRSAIEASLETLRHLETLHRETQTGGRLDTIKWYAATIVTKDFLLPAFLVMLDLHSDTLDAQASPKTNTNTADFWTPAQRAEMIRRLEVTRDIWEGLVDLSMEAAKGFNILKIMLAKIIRPEAPAASAAENANTAFSNPMEAAMFATTAQPTPQMEQSAAETLGMLSGGLSPTTANIIQSVKTPNMSVFGNMDIPMSLGNDPMLAADSSAPSNWELLNSQPLQGVVTGLGSMEFGADFDWNALQNYTENSNWGTDQSFQFVANTAKDGNQQKTSPGSGSSWSFPTPGST